MMFRTPLAIANGSILRDEGDGSRLAVEIELDGRSIERPFGLLFEDTSQLADDFRGGRASEIFSLGDDLFDVRVHIETIQVFVATYDLPSTQTTGQGRVTAGARKQGKILGQTLSDEIEPVTFLYAIVLQAIVH